ncbi:MAG: NAD-binding protein [Anaeromyxobacter sp.]
MPVRRLVLASLAISLTVALGTAGYWVIGGGDWSLFDCLYQTVIGISTAGFGEILPLAAKPAGRPFTILLLVGGLVVVGWFATTAAAFLIEGEISGLAWRRRMDRELEKLKGHVIVCGAGATGIHCVKELAAIGVPFVVVERDPELARKISQEHRCGAVVGDATHDQFLEEAGIARASGVIAALTEDKDNLFITVSARALNPKLRIVAKAIEAGADGKLKRAGADAVVSPNAIGGLRMVSEMVRPEVVSFLDVMMRDRSQPLRIEELPVPAGSPFAQKRVGELGLAAHGMLLLAVKPATAGAALVYNPGSDLRLEGGETLIVLGDANRVRELSRRSAAG